MSHIDRKRALIRLPALSILLAVLVLAAGCGLLNLPLAQGPYLTDASASTATVSWIGRGGDNYYVQYWPEDDPSTVQTADGQLVHPDWDHYRTVLTGLAPFTRYTYRLLYGRERGIAAGRNATFRTAPADSTTAFSFNAVSDLQNYCVLKQVAADMMADGETAFWLCPGDITPRPENSYWSQFFSATGAFIRQVPFKAAYGNHDSGSESLQRYMDLPDDRRWYSFDYGSVHVIALDSNSDHYPGSAQYQWLEQDLTAAADRPWRIVFFHRPQNCPTEGKWSPTVREYLNPLFDQHKVHIVFNGHSHVYMHYLVTGVNDVHYVINGGGGGCVGTQEVSEYNAPFHHVRVNVTATQLTVTCIRMGGGTVDQFTVTH